METTSYGHQVEEGTKFKSYYVVWKLCVRNFQAYMQNQV